MISFPPGNEMFQFPGLAPCGLCIHPQVTPSGCPVTPGFPIRRSPDQSLLDSSPRHIAAYHVLHRLSTPRHPPRTLSSLTTLMRGCHAGAQSKAKHNLAHPLPAPLVRSSSLPALSVLADRTAPCPQWGQAATRPRGTSGSCPTYLVHRHHIAGPDTGARNVR